MAELILAYGSLRVSVACDLPQHLDWLVEFLSPHFREAPSAEPSRRVRLVCDPDRFAVFATLSESGEETAAFLYDSSVARLPLLDHARNRVARDTVQGVFYSVTDDTREIEIVAPGTGSEGREPLMKVVRELAMHSIGIDQEALILHAAACSIGGCGIAIAGPKRAGKTSLLGFMLLAADADYITNDRVVVSLSKPGPVLHGMPTIVALRSSLFELLPVLKVRLRGSGFQSRRTLGEAAANPPTPLPAPDGRYGLSPPQYCALAQTRAVAEAPASAILFPTIGDQPGPIELAPVSREEFNRRLVDSLFGCREPSASPGLFEFEPALPSYPVERERICKMLVRTVRAYEARLGPESYRHPESVSRLVHTLQEKGG